MNKYIKSDILNAEKYMKSAIMNSLHDIDSGEEDEIDLGPNLSWNLFSKCLIEAGWIEEENDDFETNGWQVDFWTYYHSPSGKYCCIEGSLWGQNYIIRIVK